MEEGRIGLGVNKSELGLERMEGETISDCTVEGSRVKTGDEEEGEGSEVQMRRKITHFILCT